MATRTHIRTTRWRGGSGRARKSITLLGVTALATGALVTTSGPALAVHDLSMQMDGDTNVDSGTPAYDWESFFKADPNAPTPGDIGEKGDLPSGFLARGHVADYALPEHTTFATGSKDTLNIGAITSPKKLAAGWQCGNSNNLGAKDDLVNVYTVAYRNPSNNHLILYFGAEKSSNLGDNNIGIWFLQDSNVGCTVPDSGRNTDFSGHHVPGDVLLTAAFTNGGTTATVEAHTWQASADNGGEGYLGPATSGFLCGSSGNTVDKACAITNDAVNQPPAGDINPPWNHPVKTPGTDGVSLADQEFYEGGVDVTQLQIDAHAANPSIPAADPCITSFLADTRSSQSPTATLFDFAAGSFPVCKPATTLASSVSSSTIHSGDSVTWTVTEANTGTSSISNVSVTDTASSPCTFVGTKQAAPNNAYNIGDLDRDNILDAANGSTAAETWTFTCTKTLTATTTLSAFGNGTDTVSGKSVTGDPSKCTFNDSVTPPTGTPKTGYTTNTVCDPNERASSTVTVISPSTTLTNTAATVSPATAHAGDTVVFTFYEKNDGDVVLTSPSVTTDDPSCATAASKLATGTAFNVGDTNADGKLDPGEEWAFTCTTTFSSAGTKTVNAVGHGTDPLGADVTYYTVTGGGACTAGAIVSGKLCDLQERTSKSVTIINPSTVLTETASAVVTFTYVETNDGDSPITNPYVLSTCSGSGTHATSVNKTGTTVNIGDTDNDGVLDPGESWTFTCTKTVSVAGGGNGTVTYNDSSTGHGTDSAGGTVDNTTDTDEADSSSVTVTNYPTPAPTP